MNFAAFLSARLGEQEDKARALLAEAQRVSLTLQDPKYLGRSQPGWYSWPDIEAQCRSVLASVAAQRAVLALHVDANADWHDGTSLEDGGLPQSCSVCHDYERHNPEAWPCQTLRLLAQHPFGGHLDFDASWRP